MAILASPNHPHQNIHHALSQRHAHLGIAKVPCVIFTPLHSILFLDVSVAYTKHWGM